jgi:hypothetical protein
MSNNDRENTKKPSRVEIRDKWLKEVPDVATGYWLKEHFSDILQLRDRKKAEELTDLWLSRVEEYIEGLHSKYQKGEGRKRDRPFANIHTTIKKWRPYILNYIDSKSICSFAVTNFFAEHVNKKLKSAKTLGNGIAFETLRMKAIHGGVMVKRRPPHPLSDRQARPKVGGSKKRREINPDANLEQLKRAREDRDETKNLLPKPQTAQGWATRFLSTPYIPAPDPSPGDSEVRRDGNVLQHDASANQGEAGAIVLPPLPPDVIVNVQAPKAEEDDPAPEKRPGAGRRKRPMSDPDQLTMF